MLSRLAVATCRRVAYPHAARCLFSSKSSALTVGEISTLTPEEQELRAELEEEKSATQRKIEAMTKVDPYMICGSLEDDPDPELPDNPAELAALDNAQRIDGIQPDGTTRVVHIRQNQWEPNQNPMGVEKQWIISFMDDGETANTWENPLMGWVSGADPMASNINLQWEFSNAAEAVYFAKKRGWNFVVDEPIFRQGRDDGAQYQDNFLPQTVANLLTREKTLCKHWERESACASHYRRPLKYHGDGEVVQHGPNGGDPVAKHVEGHYKMR